MWILGITGALGAGKSTLSGYLKDEGIPVHSADEEIHRLLREDVAIKQHIADLWPDAIVGGEVDRQILGTCVLSSSSALSRLEDLLYPKLAVAQKAFLETYQKNHTSIVVLDVPLLFEVGLDSYCDVVILAKAPRHVREKRALKRRGMDPKRFSQFQAHQMTDGEREKRADFIVRTGGAKRWGLLKVHEILKNLKAQPTPEWSGDWPKTLKRKPHG